MHIEAALLARQQLYRRARDYLREQDVLEVETPLLGSAATTDPQIESFQLRAGGQTRYLQTSPEFFLKRLVASTGRSVYSLGKVFRNGETGRWHNPEFSMLEWYRVGFNLQGIMQDTCQLVAACLGQPELQAHRVSYRELFEQHFSLNPHRAELPEVEPLVHQYTSYQAPLVSVAEGLQLLMDQVIEPGFYSPFTLLYHFPADQCALARLTDCEGDPVAERFELYAGQLELANGYHELTDADEQAHRFANDLQQRQQAGQPQVTVDQALVEALRSGMPDCAGVSVGMDRLLAHAMQLDGIQPLLPFGWSQS